MEENLSARPDLSGEVRLKLPLIVMIPLVSLLVIGLGIFGFSRVLLALSPGAATTIAMITAANVLGACAFLALRKPSGRGSSLELLLVALYPVLIAIIIAQTGVLSAEEGHGEPQGQQEQPAPAASGNTLVAQGLAFTASTIELKAGEPNDYALQNEDQVVHNLAIFESEEDASGGGDALFTSPDVAAGATEEFEIDPLRKGEYYFHCDYHLTMSGTATVD